MTDISEYTPVIEKLLERTREGKVTWEDYNYGFRGTVKAYEFRISQSEDQGDTTVKLDMFDDRSNNIFQVRLTDDPETLRKYQKLISELKELYELARRKALNVEQKIGEVSGWLDEM